MGWPLALQLAGWPSNKPVWTGSCPCQPFSSAGKGLGDKDERHLWPVFFDLIRQCRPEYVFGEQVASAIGKGWLDGISADLAEENYTCGAVVLGAHSVGAPHRRPRLYWVASRPGKRLERPTRQELQGGGIQLPANGCRLVQPDSDGREAGSPATTGTRHGGSVDAAGFWSDHQLIQCRDGKTRRIPLEPAFFPLASRVPARVVRLRGYGNAIVPQVAAEFIASYLDIIQ